MPTIKIELISSIKRMPNNKFKYLYLHLMELTEQYAATTGDENLQMVFGRMQKEVERVKQLTVRLNERSVTVKERNEVHKDIKNMVQHIKGLLRSYLLSPSDEDRVNAKYVYGKLADLIDIKRVSSKSATTVVISRIGQTIEDDEKLVNALKELDLMMRVERLYTLGEEFEQLYMQINREKATMRDIDKTTIRKEATSTLKLLFDIIPLNHYQTKDEVWVEMAEKVKRITN